jgi:hypothetical protein
MPSLSNIAHPAKRWAHELAHAQAEPSVECVTADFRIESPTQADASAIARCFVEVYGSHYPHAEVFAPARYWASVERGELVPVIARNSAGMVVGHVALEREAGAPVAERGEAVVLPAYRGHRLLELMTGRLAEQAVALKLEGVYARPVTIHTFSQRNDLRNGMAFCAATLGLLPEDILPKGLDIPTLDTVVLATPKSDIKQSVGRILRETAGKKNEPLILDIVDAWGFLYAMFGKRRRVYRDGGFLIQGGGAPEKEKQAKLTGFSFKV